MVLSSPFVLVLDPKQILQAARWDAETSRENVMIGRCLMQNRWSVSGRKSCSQAVCELAGKHSVP